MRLFLSLSWRGGEILSNLAYRRAYNENYELIIMISHPLRVQSWIAFAFAVRFVVLFHDDASLCWFVEHLRLLREVATCLWSCESRVSFHTVNF